MNDFLRGWRRKASLVTMFVAMGFVILWVRSHSIVDQINFRSDKQTVQVIATDRTGFIFMTLRDPDQVLAIDEIYHSQKPNPDGFLSGFEIDWPWKWGGFQYGKMAEQNRLTGRPVAGGSKSGTREGWGRSEGEVGMEMMLPINDPVTLVRVMILPNWFAVLLLTLLSGFLFFGMPRRTVLPKMTVPDPVPHR